MEQTLSIIKPDAVSKSLIGKICAILEEKEFRIIRAKMLTLSNEQAYSFYQEHAKMPFFNILTEFMTSSASLILVLERDAAISVLRSLMGHTDPKKADKNTIRGIYGENITKNAIHGSDSNQSALREIEFFRKELE